MINSVYNTVRVIANNQVYGAITQASFNLLAKNAQIKVLSDTIDQYRPSKQDKSNFKKMREIDQVLALFYDSQSLQRAEVGGTIQKYFDSPKDENGDFNMMIDDDISFNGNPITLVPKGKFDLYKRNRLTRPDLVNPIAYKMANKFYIFPEEIGLAGGIKTTDVTIGYYRFPTDPVLTYVTGTTMLDPTEPKDFELPLNFHDKLVLEILSQVGVHLREEQIEAYAERAKAEEKQNENL